MKIATWNVNSIRQRMDTLQVWLKERAPDIVCLQELKATDRQFPRTALADAGYGAVFVGQSAWNGVAILARGLDPIVTQTALPGDDSDEQARMLADMGARVIFVSANTRSKTGEVAQLGREYHMSNIRMRARAAKAWVVVVNAGDPIGFQGEPPETGPRLLPAPSGVVDPNGNWKTLVTSAEEQCFVYTIELDAS